MAGLSDYLENGLLNVFRGTAFPLAATGSVYVALHTADPTDAGTGTEVSGTAYARQGITKASGSWAAPTGNPAAITNAAAVTFPAAGAGGWGTVTHVAIWDASTAGNLLFSGALTASKAVAQDDVVQFAIGQLALRVD
jgi:hypothetical protein